MTPRAIIIMIGIITPSIVVSMMKYPETENITESKDISANPAERPLLTILDAIRVFMGVGSVGGVIEVDEAFFRESFKGNLCLNCVNICNYPII